MSILHAEQSISDFEYAELVIIGGSSGSSIHTIELLLGSNDLLLTYGSTPKPYVFHESSPIPSPIPSPLPSPPSSPLPEPEPAPPIYFLTASLRTALPSTNHENFPPLFRLVRHSNIVEQNSEEELTINNNNYANIQDPPTSNASLKEITSSMARPIFNRLEDKCCQENLVQATPLLQNAFQPLERVNYSLSQPVNAPLPQENSQETSKDETTPTPYFTYEDLVPPKPGPLINYKCTLFDNIDRLRYLFIYRCSVEQRRKQGQEQGQKQYQKPLPLPFLKLSYIRDIKLVCGKSNPAELNMPVFQTRTIQAVKIKHFPKLYYNVSDNETSTFSIKRHFQKSEPPYEGPQVNTAHSFNTKPKFADIATPEFVLFETLPTHPALPVKRLSHIPCQRKYNISIDQLVLRKKSKGLLRHIVSKLSIKTFRFKTVEYSGVRRIRNKKSLVSAFERRPRLKRTYRPFKHLSTRKDSESWLNITYKDIMKPRPPRFYPKFPSRKTYREYIRRCVDSVNKKRLNHANLKRYTTYRHSVNSLSEKNSFTSSEKDDFYTRATYNVTSKIFEEETDDEEASRSVTKSSEQAAYSSLDLLVNNGNVIHQSENRLSNEHRGVVYTLP